MIGLDTNVLVRVFIDDDPGQTHVVRRLVANAKRGELLVSIVVLVEFVWTLRAAFKLRKGAVAVALAGLLTRDVFVIEHRHEVEAALKRYRSEGLDPADYLISSRNRSLGATGTVSFDERAISAGIFEAPDP